MEYVGAYAPFRHQLGIDKSCATGFGNAGGGKCDSVGMVRGGVNDGPSLNAMAGTENQN